MLLPSIKLLIGKTTLPIIVLVGVFTIISVILGQYTWISSMILGLIFSYLIFQNLAKTQQQILAQKKVALFFPQYIIRLLLYAGPIALSLWQDGYFNFGVTLLFLFVVQVNFIILVVKRNLKKRIV